MNIGKPVEEAIAIPRQLPATAPAPQPERQEPAPKPEKAKEPVPA